MKKINCINKNKILEDRFLLEEGVCRWQMTDDKRDIDPKDVH